MTDYTVSGSNIQNGGGQLTVRSGDTITVVNGGTVSRGTVNVAGRLVFSSGTAGSNISDSGTIDAYAPMDHVAVASGGILNVHPTGYDVLANGQQFTSATNTVISAGGREVIGDPGDPSEFIAALDMGAFIYGGTQIVLPGGVSVSATVLNSGRVVVSSGGFASATDVGYGSITVLAGGLAAAAVIERTGQLVVSSGGTASNATISSGGALTVYGSSTSDTVAGTVSVGAGGSEDFVRVTSGGTVTVAGTLNRLYVSAGVAVTVSSGGVLTSALITNGTIDSTTSGGVVTVSSSFVYASGPRSTLSVVSGGVANGVKLDSADMVIAAGGTAADVIIGRSLVSSGSTASAGNATLLVYGSATNVMVGSGFATYVPFAGDLTVASGGVVSGVVLATAGRAGATSGHVTVSSGGAVYGIAQDALYGPPNNQSATVDVVDMGLVSVNAGDTLTRLSVLSGGVVTVGSGATVSGLVSTGGTAHYDGAYSTGLLFSGGTAELAGGASMSGAFLTSGALVTQVLLSGGSASATAVNLGATQIVSSGTASNTAILFGGQQLVIAGTATNTSVTASGTLSLVGGRADGARVSAGGTLQMQNALASGTVVLGGGTASVGNGATLQSATVSAGGVVTLVSGGAASGTVLSSGGLLQMTQAAASATVVSSGGTVVIGTGATAQASVVGKGGTVTVSAGGTAVATTVSSGGTENVLSSGYAANTIILGGTQVVSAGGTTDSVTVSENNGTQSVSGGTTYGTVLLSAGAGRVGQQLVSDGVASGTLVSGGVQMVGGATATAIGTQIAAGGNQFVYDGTASGTTISAGGNQFLEGGTTRATTVLSGGTQTVDSGGTAQGTIVGSGGRMVVSSGGTAGTIVVSSGGTLRVETPSLGIGTISGGTVEVAGVAAPTQLSFKGGTEILLSGATHNAIRVAADQITILAISSGASASGAQVSSGGTITVFSGGITSGGRVAANGTQIVSSGGTSYNPSLMVGGTLVDNGAIVLTSSFAYAGTLTGSGTVTVSGGTLQLFGSSSSAFAGTVTVASGATLTVSGAQAAGTGTIRLTAGATLDIRGTALPTTQITGFTSGTTIDIEALAYTSGNTATVSNGVLTIQGAGALAMPDVPNGTLFTTSRDTGGGTLVQQVVCFCRGTLIRTEHGETPVERLTPGTRLLTPSGTMQPVIWVGARSFGPAHITHGPYLPPTAWPIRIDAHAFGPGTPHTPLYVSPGHALYHQGTLIPAFALVNGTTIRPQPVAEIDYFHIELPTHDLVFANGMAAETWLDTGNRPFFDNAPVTTLHRPASDAFLLGATGHCLPWHADGPAVTAARQAAHAQALALGWAYTQQPDLHLQADGLRIDPAWNDGNILCFTIPPNGQDRIQDLRLASRTTRTTDRDPNAPDVRRLGVAIEALRIDGAPIDLATLEDQPGWWSQESTPTPARSWRWTDGAALLPPATTSLMVSIAHRGTYLEAPIPHPCPKPNVIIYRPSCSASSSP